MSKKKLKRSAQSKKILSLDLACEELREAACDGYADPRHAGHRVAAGEYVVYFSGLPPHLPPSKERRSYVECLDCGKQLMQTASYVTIAESIPRV
jgi:hypothetical protein